MPELQLPPPDASAPKIFDGVPPDELARVFEESARTRFLPGEVVIAQGDVPDKIFLVAGGSAEVTVVDRAGRDHRVAVVGSGMTVGEMSLITREPAAGTVRALSDLELIAMSGGEFERLAARCPQVYRNLGVILARRLARTNRLVAEARVGELIAVENAGAPLELAWALACSIAWHTRGPTLLIALTDDPPETLAALARAEAKPAELRATLQLARSLGSLGGPDSGDLDEALRRFDRVLVVGRADALGTLHGSRRLLLDRENGAPAPEVGTVVRGWSRDAPAALGPDAAGVVRVPGLAPEDVEWLREGRLPVGSAAGRALGWVARDLAGLKVGFAFGAGSARGYAHAGVLAAFERYGLRADYLAGTSVGAAVVTLHAMGRSPNEIADELDRCGEVIFRPTLSRRALLSNRPLRRYLHSVSGELRIEELSTPTALIAADLESRQEVALRQGYIWAATLAAISIPGVLPAVRLGGRMLVDGGILNPVPTSTVEAMGADAVVAVRLSPPPGGLMLDVVAAEERGSIPSALNVILTSVETMHGRIVSDSPQKPLITIAPVFPDVAGAKLRKFSSGRRYVEAGAAAAEAALPRLATVFPWLGS